MDKALLIVDPRNVYLFFDENLYVKQYRFKLLPKNGTGR